MKETPREKDFTKEDLENEEKGDSSDEEEAVGGDSDESDDEN
jgi:hypothetical protein